MATSLRDHGEQIAAPDHPQPLGSCDLRARPWIVDHGLTISGTGEDTMRMILALTAALAALLAVAVEGATRSAHELSFTSIDGEALPMSGFAGKAVLVVNTASFCGFTYQYAALQNLWQTYRERGLVVLGVPSNDFGAQEPGSATEIKEFCEVNFDVDFPLTEKQVVKGADAHPFFAFAIEQLGADAGPRWNFHKYLITPDGRLVGSWPSRVEPDSAEITGAIEAVLPR
jgi:glutathione peroxidase